MTFRTIGHRRPLHTHGFSLIEVMVVVALVAITTTMAVPAWNDMIINARTRTAVNDWIASQQFARSEALRLNTAVTLCASSDGINCTAQDFEIGWIVKRGLPAAAVAAGDLLQDALPRANVTMVPGTNAGRSFTFLPTGLPIGNFNGALLTVRDANTATPAALNKRICISKSGRTRVFTEAQWLALTSAAACST